MHTVDIWELTTTTWHGLNAGTAGYQATSDIWSIPNKLSLVGVQYHSDGTVQVAAAQDETRLRAEIQVPCLSQAIR